MKSALIALVLAFALIIPVAASAQDWVMDWTSTGHDLFNNWSISGTSTATLGNSPPLNSDQAPPPSSEIQSPSSVPTKRRSGLTTSSFTTCA